MATTHISQYLLRWNDHLANYGDIFLSLHEQEEFVDCSIACEDGIVDAHRIVLAGCSTYLRDLFARIAKPHPVICLPNTSRSLVLMLMEFIYRGQVHIPQHHLQQLVVLGQALKIKGLTQIMMPVSTASSKNGEPSSSITPLAFPHGLPNSTASSLPFSTVPCCNNTNLDTSVLSCANGQQTPEEKGEGDRLVEEEENNKDKDKGTGSDVNHKRLRARSQSLHQEKPVVTKAAVQCNAPSRKSYFRSAKEKSSIGAYALLHGIEAAKRYIKEKYDVRVKATTLYHMILFYKKYEKCKEMKAKCRITKRRRVTSQK